MNPAIFRADKLLRPATGAALAVLCGLFLWGARQGEGWVNLSYDCLFYFGSRPATNGVVLIQMDKQTGQIPGQSIHNWDRSLYTQLLNRLTADGCRLVVFDILFRAARDEKTDSALAEAMRRHGRVVLMAGFDNPKTPVSFVAEANLPNTNFRNAAAAVGIGNAGVYSCETVRQPWSFTIPTDDRDIPSLPWAAARLSTEHLSKNRERTWLRYYADGPGWDTWSYHLATNLPAGYFRNKIVFIGSSPDDPDPRIVDQDKYCTPFSRWTHKAVGGVEIMATEFLNLINGDSLRRLPGWLEALLLVATGSLLGWGLCVVRRLVAFILALCVLVLVMVAVVTWSYHTNYWFPWLIISGGQVPCALAWALAAPGPMRVVESRSDAETEPELEAVPSRVVAHPGIASGEQWPDAPDYKFFGPAFGEGGFGKVWLVRNAIGQWQALKAVYQSKFRESSHAYDTEFLGVQRYKPVSDKHPGLLRVDFVSLKKPEGYFYYVMELGDGIEPGWEQNPASYKPRDLRQVLDCAQAEKGRLPGRECVRIALALSEALEFLHGQNLAHRDLKPSNILFFNGQPKLGDIGLVSDIRPTIERQTAPGTYGYMPPPPELPGSPQADIFALGMVLYVMYTGCSPSAFPEVCSTIVESVQKPDFRRLNAIIIKACQPDRTLRYRSATEMRAALLEVWNELESEPKVMQA